MRALRAELVLPCLEPFQARQLIAFVRLLFTAYGNGVALADERRHVAKKQAAFIAPKTVVFGTLRAC